MREGGMRLRRRKLLVEPPPTAAPDIAFMLIVFFLVCASVQPETGRSQSIPRSEEASEPEQQSQNIEVSLTPKNIIINSEIVAKSAVTTRLRQLLAGKDLEADRVVIVKSSEETGYQHWIDVTTLIEDAGGIITLQLEREERVLVD
jgi:biopolymer transport protein ExbD